MFSYAHDNGLHQIIESHGDVICTAQSSGAAKAIIAILNHSAATSAAAPQGVADAIKFLAA